MHDDFLAQLEQQIRDVRNHKIPRPVKKKESNLWFFVSVAVLTVAIVFVYTNKNINFSTILQDRVAQTIEEQDPKLLEIVKGLWETQQKHQELIKTLGDRMAITGAVLNNNTAVTQNKYSVEDYVYISRDWKMNQQPKHLRATPKERQIIDQYSK